MARRVFDWLWGNVLGVLIIVYFVFKFALTIVLWAVLGPVAFAFMLFGSEAIFSLLDTIVDGLDSAAWRVWNVLDVTSNEGDPPERVA